MQNNQENRIGRLAKPLSLPGFQTSKSNLFYALRRTFKRYSPLKDYLNEKFPKIVNDKNQTYTLLEILQLIETIVTKEKLYDDRNPCIIICDEDLSKALKVKCTITSDVQFHVSKQLLISCCKKCHIQIMKKQARITDRKIIHPPRWASYTSTAIIAARNTKDEKPNGELRQIYPNLREFIIKYKKIPEDTELFNEIDIRRTIMKYIRDDEDRILINNDSSIAVIKNTPLEKALGVNAFDLHQLASLVQHQTMPKEIIESEKSKNTRQEDSIPEEILNFIMDINE